MAKIITISAHYIKMTILSEITIMVRSFIPLMNLTLFHVIARRQIRKGQMHVIVSFLVGHCNYEM